MKGGFRILRAAKKSSALTLPMGDNMMRNFVRLMAVALVLTACADEVVDSPPDTLLLGHRGTGSGVRNGFLENTPRAVREALKYADGVEQDIQMSADGTLWVFHDGAFDYLCSETIPADSAWVCVPTTPDSVLSELRLCRDGIEERIHRLDDLLEVMQAYPNKVVSLDVKGYFDERCIPGGNVSNEYLEEAARGLAIALERYDMVDRAFIETNYVRVFEVLKEKNTNIRCHLLGYTDLRDKIDRVVEHGWDGVSFNRTDTSLTTRNVERLQRAGLSLQLWTLRNEEDYRDVADLHPTAVQVSGVEVLRAIRESRKRRGD